jgi:hypothetical protein
MTDSNLEATDSKRDAHSQTESGRGLVILLIVFLLAVGLLVLAAAWTGN